MKVAYFVAASVLALGCGDLNDTGSNGGNGATNLANGGGGELPFSNNAGTQNGPGPDGTGGAGVDSGEAGAGPGPNGGAPPLVNAAPIQFDLSCEAPAVGSPTLRLLTRTEFLNTLADIFPAAAGEWTDTLPANAVSKAGFDNSSDATVGNQLAEKLLETAEGVAGAVTGPALATLLPCSGAGADHACAEEFLNTYGRRLFRRPLTTEESERYLTFFDSALTRSDFPTALKWVTVGLIQSPHAMYRSEIGAPGAEGLRALTALEIATEIAYTFSGSTPSEALILAAESGDLGDVASVVTELLETERGQEAVHRFFEGYLSYPRAAATQKPAIAEFSSVSADMVAETRAFIQDVAYTSRAGVRELLTASTTNPSAALASYYGMPAPSGDYASVARPEGRGVGVLAQGAFLATNANSDSSSPTRRGLFPLVRLLCQITPPLPDNVPNLQVVEPGVRTTRQRYEEQHGQAGTACAACHINFDPIGFAFEHFDEGGRYRENEQGLPIDATGAVKDTSGGDLFTFDGQEELMLGLVEQEAIYQCFSSYLATYAFGSTTSCLGPSRAADLRAGTVGIVEAFAALASEPHFTQRAAQ